ncbi:hypothetical protein IQ235_08335 [Oscillatoriales cyanobacterium LEGE 11467]|uniref:Uncharacterized protein n=1 Tax=Zarconia navalis LEGE 11467 TaxID=1828826 RepID=A0A928VWF0_9CYAN|nr:hypothetical protein [Zarconia navalis LEGE 11467]
MSRHYPTPIARSSAHPIAIARTVLSKPPDERMAQHNLSSIEGVLLIRDIREIVDRYRQRIHARAQLKK